MASSKTAIWAAIAGNMAVAVTKFVAAAASGSSSMLSEGVHSLVDTGNAALLLVGVRVSQREPDAAHPFGYGKELYFYSLLVAVLIFGVGGGVSIYEGILHVIDAEPIRDRRTSYIVLGISAVFEIITWAVALKAFLRVKGRRTVWGAVRQTKDPTTFAVLLEDSAAVTGLAFAALGIYLSERLARPWIDGAASIAIGLLLCGIATVLLRESKGLLIGESAAPQVLEAVRETTRTDPAVTGLGRIMSMHLGPDEILLNLTVQFRPTLDAAGIAAAIDRLERAIRHVEPRIHYVFIEAEALAAVGREASAPRESTREIEA